MYTRKQMDIMLRHKLNGRRIKPVFVVSKHGRSVHIYSIKGSHKQLLFKMPIHLHFSCALYSKSKKIYIKEVI